MAAMKTLLDERIPETVGGKEKLFLSELNHPKIKTIRSFGLWMALEFESLEICKKVVDNCIQKGVLTDWFLFAANCLRISPPLVIPENQIKKACKILTDVCSVL